MRDVFEEGCHVDLVRASEMSLSLWLNKYFGAVLVGNPALKQHPEVSWRRETHHICAVLVMWVKTPSHYCCVLLLCMGAGHKFCRDKADSRHQSATLLPALISFY